MRTSAQYLVAGLDQAGAQLVIDEWAGALAAGVIQRSPLGYPNNRAASGPIFRVTRE